MNNEGTNHPPPVYSTWFGKSVVVLIAFRHCHVPVPCSIISESIADVRVQIQPGLEMNLRKELILAVEEDAAGPSGPSGPDFQIH